jgi:hypothetical protein
VAAVQAICDELGPGEIDALLRKWLAILRHPFTAADRAAGYRYDLSVLQAEFSLTQMLDKPVSGRMFFEQVIRDNLDIGRPDQVSLVFDRQLRWRGPRPTPGRFRTRVITSGVIPSLHVDYKRAAASPNSPPRHPPRAVCYPLPPYTAPRSKTSPRQHNSRNETSTATTPLKHQRT